jgi:hypothetical protein
MGIETALITAAVVAAGASIAGGVSAQRSANQEAKLQREQGGIANAEAQRQAAIRAEEVRKFSKVQKLAFLKSGVTLEGSPLLTLDETLTQGQEEVDAISRSGASQYNLAQKQARITQNKGRAALIGGIGNAAGAGLTYYGVAHK